MLVESEIKGVGGWREGCSYFTKEQKERKNTHR